MENKWKKNFRFALNNWLDHEGMDRDWLREHGLSHEMSDWEDMASLPLDVFMSVLKSMPVEMRFACLSDLLEPLGLEVRRRHVAAPSEHQWMDDVRFAYASMLEVMDTPELDVALEALEDAIEAKREARWKLEMALSKVQDVRDIARFS